MEAKVGFFQKCQQFLSWRGGNNLEGNGVKPPDKFDDDQNFDQNCREPTFFRSYQKVSTCDATTK